MEYGNIPLNLLPEGKVGPTPGVSPPDWPTPVQKYIVTNVDYALSYVYQWLDEVIKGPEATNMPVLIDTTSSISRKDYIQEMERQVAYGKPYYFRTKWLFESQATYALVGKAYKLAPPDGDGYDPVPKGNISTEIMGGLETQEDLPLGSQGTKLKDSNKVVIYQETSINTHPEEGEPQYQGQQIPPAEVTGEVLTGKREQGSSPNSVDIDPEKMEYWIKEEVKEAWTKEQELLHIVESKYMMLIYQCYFKAIEELAEQALADELMEKGKKMTQEMVSEALKAAVIKCRKIKTTITDPGLRDYGRKFCYDVLDTGIPEGPWDSPEKNSIYVHNIHMLRKQKTEELKVYTRYAFGAKKRLEAYNKYFEERHQYRPMGGLYKGQENYDPFNEKPDQSGTNEAPLDLSKPKPPFKLLSNILVKPSKRRIRIIQEGQPQRKKVSHRPYPITGKEPLKDLLNVPQLDDLRKKDAEKYNINNSR